MEKEFDVIRQTNGRGNSHLLAITDPAVEDVLYWHCCNNPLCEWIRRPY